MVDLLRCKVTLVFDNGVTYDLDTKLPLEPVRAKSIRADIIQQSIHDDCLPFLGMRPVELYDRVVINVIYTHEGREVFAVTGDELLEIIKIILAHVGEAPPRTNTVQLPVRKPKLDEETTRPQGALDKLRFNDVGYEGDTRSQRLLAANLHMGNSRAPVGEYLFRADTIENFEEDFRAFWSGKVRGVLFVGTEKKLHAKAVHSCIVNDVAGFIGWYRENEFFTGLDFDPTRKVVRL